MKFKTKLFAPLFIFALFLPTLSYAFPKAPFDALKTVIKSQKALDPKYDFNGIVKLSNCSGSIVQFSGMPDSAKAIVMTNGHCIGGSMVQPNEFFYDKPVNRAMRVYTKNGSLISVTATKILYATMTGTDVAFYELTDTYSSLASKGIESFDFEGQRPGVGTAIDIVSGYWDRGYRCNIDGFVFTLKEAGWTFKDSIRYSSPGCEIIGGTSGSPIIQTGTRSVIGINNTTNESGRRCTMNNPCEVSEMGDIEVRKSTGYGQQTYNVYSCLTPAFKIDLKKPGCELFSK